MWPTQDTADVTELRLSLEESADAQVAPLLSEERRHVEDKLQQLVGAARASIVLRLRGSSARVSPTRPGLCFIPHFAPRATGFCHFVRCVGAINCGLRFTRSVAQADIRLIDQTLLDVAPLRAWLAQPMAELEAHRERLGDQAERVLIGLLDHGDPAEIDDALAAYADYDTEVVTRAKRMAATRRDELLAEATRRVQRMLSSEKLGEVEAALRQYRGYHTSLARHVRLLEQRCTPACEMHLTTTKVVLYFAPD